MAAKASNTNLVARIRMYHNRLTEFYSGKELNEFLSSLADFRHFAEEYMVDNRIKVDVELLDMYFCTRTHNLFENIYRKNVEAIQRGFYVHIPLPQLSFEHTQAEAKKLAQMTIYLNSMKKK